MLLIKDISQENRFKQFDLEDYLIQIQFNNKYTR